MAKAGSLRPPAPFLSCSCHEWLKWLFEGPLLTVALPCVGPPCPAPAGAGLPLQEADQEEQGAAGGPDGAGQAEGAEVTEQREETEAGSVSAPPVPAPGAQRPQGPGASRPSCARGPLPSPSAVAPETGTAASRSSSEGAPGRRSLPDLLASPPGASSATRRPFACRLSPSTWPGSSSTCRRAKPPNSWSPWSSASTTTPPAAARPTCYCSCSRRRCRRRSGRVPRAEDDEGKG